LYVLLQHLLIIFPTKTFGHFLSATKEKNCSTFYNKIKKKNIRFYFLTSRFSSLYLAFLQEVFEWPITKYAYCDYQRNQMDAPNHPSKEFFKKINVNLFFTQSGSLNISFRNSGDI